MIYVTHDQVEAMTLADRIVVLDTGQIIQVSSPRALYTDPANTFVAQFIGSPKMNVIPCTSTGSEFSLPGGRRGPCPNSAATQLGIRPEHITVTSKGEGQCEATADVIEYLGADTFVLFDCGQAGSVNVRISGETDLATGDTIGLSFDPARTVFFDADGNGVR